MFKPEVDRRAVFPAHAGMSPISTERLQKLLGFPRTRGDEPYFGDWEPRTSMFSPHTRG